jgi:hypothetical protein
MLDNWNFSFPPEYDFKTHNPSSLRAKQSKALTFGVDCQNAYSSGNALVVDNQQIYRRDQILLLIWMGTSIISLETLCGLECF